MSQKNNFAVRKRVAGYVAKRAELIFGGKSELAAIAIVGWVEEISCTKHHHRVVEFKKRRKRTGRK